MHREFSDLIKKRTSIRTYEYKPLENKTKEKIITFINDLSDLPFGIKTNFSIIETGNMGSNKIKLGTYGFIKGAFTFITAATTKGKYKLETLGFQMEKIILYAAKLNLGTCWLGGTFNRSFFAKAINLNSNEFLPIITSIGYPSNKLRFRDKIVRRAAGSDNRKSFNEIFFLNDFDTLLDVSSAGKYYNALEMTRLSPSASNKQPWLLVLDYKNNIIHIYLNRSKKYLGNKLGFEIQKIDIGIAMCHFECALIDDDINGEFVFADPNLELPISNETDVIYEVSFKIR